MKKKKSAIDQARDMFASLMQQGGRTAQGVIGSLPRVASSVGTPRRNVTSANFKPLFQTRLQNVRPINYRTAFNTMKVPVGMVAPPALRPALSLVPSRFQPQITPRQSFNLVKSQFVEPVTRAGFEATQTLAKDRKTYQFKSGIPNVLFGSEPLRHYQDPKRPARENLRRLGLPENRVNQLAPGLIAAGLAADVLPNGPGKAGKLLPRQIALLNKATKLKYGKAPMGFTRDLFQRVEGSLPEIVQTLKNWETNKGYLPNGQADLRTTEDMYRFYKEMYGAKKKLPQDFNRLASEVQRGMRTFLSYRRAARANAPQVTGMNAAPIGNSVGLIEREAADATQAPLPKYAGNINLQHLNVPTAAKQQVAQTVEQVKPVLEQTLGKVMKNSEVIEAAKEAEALSNVVSPEQSLQAEAALLKLRQAVAAGAEGQGLTPDFVENLRVLSSHATDAGRRLQSFSIGADPALGSTKEKIVARLVRLGHKTEDLVKLGENVDWSDNRQVVEFYRKFEKAGFREILEEYRYMNLLSSPKTHIVNVFSNLLQASVVRPTTKLASGFVDPVVSSLTGAKRQHYLAEVPAYYRGMFASIPNALQKVADVYSGKQAFTNLDIERIPTNTALTKYNVVTKTLEAMDQFFMTLIQGAEGSSQQVKRAAGAIPHMTPEEVAQQTVFRQGLLSEGQGPLLNWIDQGTKAVLTLRKVPGFGWFVPFVQTPMNILKQGVEYSPAGFATAVGAKDVSEQTAKALLGSAVFMGAGYLALQDRLSWAVPKDRKQRDAFFAAGMQPYSVKVGDKWVSFSKIGPLAYPLALAAGIKYAFEDNPEAVTQSMDQKSLSALSGVMGFFANQSYMQGIGDLVKSIEGQEGFNLPRLAGNVATQYIPLSSLQRWVTQIIDPVYRKSDTVLGNIAKGIPGLSTTQDYYTDPNGNPSMRQFPKFNALSPLQVTKENPEFVDDYGYRQERLEYNALHRNDPSAEMIALDTLNEVRGLPKEQKIARLKEIKRDNPALFREIKRVSKDKKQGLTDDQIRLRALGVINGERAKEIVNVISDMSKEEKVAYLKQLKKSGVLSDDVLAQVKALRRKQP